MVRPCLAEDVTPARRSIRCYIGLGSNLDDPAVQVTSAFLLDNLQQIERLQKRKRLVRWGPRTIDLDLLLYGQETVRNERLGIPHPHLMWRNCVLVPLAEIAPDLILKTNIDASAYLALSRMKKPFRVKNNGLVGKELRG